MLDDARRIDAALCDAPAARSDRQTDINVDVDINIAIGMLSSVGDVRRPQQARTRA